MWVMKNERRTLKVFFLILVAIPFFTFNSFGAVPGDVDNSEIIDLRDAIIAIRVCIGEISSGTQKAADVNNDNIIGLAEAVFVLQVVANLRDSMSNQLPFGFKAHDPSRLVEIEPGTLGVLTTTNSNDQEQNSALRMYVIDTDTENAQWETWEQWSFGEVIPGVEEWHLPWMETYGYASDPEDEFHKELSVVAPTFYRSDIIYFSLWNELGGNAADENGKVGAMYRAIYRAVAEGEWPDQEWMMEPYPVYYSDTGTFEAGMPRGIDAHVWDDKDGQTYMTFGSWDPEGSSVIQIAEMDEETGRIEGIAPNEPGYWENAVNHLHPVATFGEAAFSYRHEDWYYLFLNVGSCCSGVNSTYEIVVGRSQSVFGPYVDHQGRSFENYYDYDEQNFPGKSVLSSSGRFIGPGHTGIYEHPDGRLILTFHYYDGEDGGAAKLGLRELRFDNEGWPIVFELP